MDSIGIGQKQTDIGEIEITLSIGAKQTIDSDTPIPLVWSGSLTNRQSLQSSDLFNAFISLRVGFITGDRAEENIKNLYYPFLEFGVGMQFYCHINQQYFITIMPEFGLIPGMPYTGDPLSVAAPTVALSMAFGKKNKIDH